MPGMLMGLDNNEFCLFLSKLLFKWPFADKFFWLSRSSRGFRYSWSSKWLHVGADDEVINDRGPGDGIGLWQLDTALLSLDDDAITKINIKLDCV